MKTVNKAQVLAAIRRAVKRRGKSWRGVSGRYFNADGTPACLLGDIAANEWGLQKRDLGEYANTSGVSALRNRLENKGITFTPEALNLLRLTQKQNDRGVLWGEVFRNAVKYKDPVRK